VWLRRAGAIRDRHGAVAALRAIAPEYHPHDARDAALDDETVAPLRRVNESVA
jgi:hypothetical protein